MRDFVIMTDSCCDLTDQMARELELSVVPLSLHMGEHLYQNWLDGRDIGFEDFYARIRAGEMATTSAVSVGEFEAVMRPILAQGKDILYIGFSSALSTTYQSAAIAADACAQSSPTRPSLWWTPCAPPWARGFCCTCALSRKRRATPSARCAPSPRPPRATSATGSPWTT